MNTHIRHSLSALTVTVMAVLILNTAVADDLNAPGYRGDPLSVYAHWVNLPGTPLLELESWNSVDDSDPTTILHSLLPPDIIEPTLNHEYKFHLPNWIDKEPVKYMRVQLTWVGDNTSPIFLEINGDEGGSLVPGNIVGTSAIIPVDAAAGIFYQYFDIEFYPNPDMERWAVDLQDNSFLIQAVVDTVSTVPEPATLLLLGLGGLALRVRHGS